ncbi:MAG: hypothetical protein ACRDRZ_04510 [Pseudonocardiaceae bacterium]
MTEGIESYEAKYAAVSGSPILARCWHAIDEPVAGRKADLAAYRSVEEVNIPKVAAAAAWD